MIGDTDPQTFVYKENRFIEVQCTFLLLVQVVDFKILTFPETNFLIKSANHNTPGTKCSSILIIISYLRLCVTINSLGTDSSSKMCSNSLTLSPSSSMGYELPPFSWLLHYKIKNNIFQNLKNLLFSSFTISCAADQIF